MVEDAAAARAPNDRRRRRGDRRLVDREHLAVSGQEERVRHHVGASQPRRRRAIPAAPNLIMKYSHAHTKPGRDDPRPEQPA